MCFDARSCNRFLREAKKKIHVNAGQKAALTRKINQLEAEYQAHTSAGKKAAVRREINKLKNERWG